MRYKFNSNGLAQGSAIPLKCEPITATAAAIMGGASLLGSVFSGLFGSSQQNTQYKQQKELMKYNQELGFENMRYQQKLGLDTFDKTFQKEASLNSQLMRNSPTIQKEAAISAGINPASQFGSFSGNLAQSSVPTYTPQSGAPSAPAMPNTDLYGMGSLISKLADIATVGVAKARKDNADAEHQEMENQAQKEENTVYSALQSYTKPVWNGNKLEFVFEGDEDKKDELPELITTNTNTRKGVEAVQNAWSRMMKENAENLSSISQAELAQKLAQMKMENNAWANAVIKSDIATYSKILKEVKHLNNVLELDKLQIDYDKERNKIQLTEEKAKELEYKIREETNLVTMTEKLLHGKFGLKEMIIGAFTLLMAAK